MSKLLTKAVEPQPSKIYMLFSATSTDNTHTTEEHRAKVRSESRGSIVICGQRLTYLPCAKKAEKKERKKHDKKMDKKEKKKEFRLDSNDFGFI